MTYDFDYYSGNDLRYPTKPVKPRLEKNATSTAVRSYADDLEQHEKEMEKYKNDLSYYRSQKADRLKEFQDQLRDAYDINQSQLNVLWHHAWERGHSGGLSEVYGYFQDYYEMASKFANEIDHWIGNAFAAFEKNR